MEVGTTGVSMLEAGGRLAVVGIGLGELMSLAVSVDSSDTPEIARHFGGAKTTQSRDVEMLDEFTCSILVLV